MQKAVFLPTSRREVTTTTIGVAKVHLRAIEAAADHRPVEEAAVDAEAALEVIRDRDPRQSAEDPGREDGVDRLRLVVEEALEDGLEA